MVKNKMKRIIIPLSLIVITILLTSNSNAMSFDMFSNNQCKIVQLLNNPPYPASNPIPANNSINIALNVSLVWIGGDPDGDPVSYNIFFGISSNPPNVKVVYRNNTYNPGRLLYSTKYYWRIDTYDDSNGGATTGPLWSFTTKDNTPPFIPFNPTPSNHASNIQRNISLNWSGGDIDGDNVTYDVYFGTVVSPPNKVMRQNNTSYTPETLDYNTVYYWRIDARDEYNSTTTGPVWTFTTKDDTPPYTPHDPIPDNQSINISVNSSLTWSCGDPDNDTVKYTLYLGTSSNPPLEAENVTNTTYIPNVFDFITTYFWRVDATDDYGYTTVGPVWSFTTRENAPPNVPSKPVPENGSTNVYIDAILSWNCTDPDGDPVTYDVYFGMDPNPPLVESNQLISSYEPTELNITTVYYWRIVAWDDHNHSSSSTIWDFKTSIYTNSPPEKPSRPSGPSSGRPGVSYTYSAITTDSNGEPIFYKFDWDDGTETDWLGPYNSGQRITASHIWDQKGNYAIKVKAKDIYGGESFWSDPLAISMPKSNALFLMQYIIDRFPLTNRILKLF
jgi:hypothetical protein